MSYKGCTRELNLCYFAGITLIFKIVTHFKIIAFLLLNTFCCLVPPCYVSVLPVFPAVVLLSICLTVSVALLRFTVLLQRRSLSPIPQREEEVGINSSLPTAVIWKSSSLPLGFPQNTFLYIKSLSFQLVFSPSFDY